MLSLCKTGLSAVLTRKALDILYCSISTLYDQEVHLPQAP